MSVWRRKPKYQNKRVQYNGQVFDSKRELNRYLELALLEKAGEISELKTQVRYQLIPSQYVGGRLKERPCYYVADFTYRKDDETVVEDAKGYRTPEYVIKRKLMLQKYGIVVREV